ncbi:MAG: pilus assembly protein PilM [Candidatus Margulisiibacteriota bacterium]|jgi:type IV pilus assembly protein PilM
MAKAGLFGRHLHFVLDIGYSSVKVALMANNNIQFMDVALIPPMENEERRKYEILKVIRSFINHYKIKISHVDLIISDPSIYVRFLEIKHPYTDLNTAVYEMIETVLPYGLDSAQVNHFIVGERKVKEDSFSDVMVVSILKSVVKSISDVVSKLGLIVTSVQVSPLVMQNYAENNLPEDQELTQSVMFIDLGARKTELTIIEDHRLDLFRSLTLGGQSFTKKIADDLDISFANAEMLKIQFGTASTQQALPGEGAGEQDQEAQVKNALGPVFADLLDEIKRTISCYRSNTSYRAIERIYLCGGGSNFKHMADFLQVGLDLPVSRLEVDPAGIIAHIGGELLAQRQISENLHYFNLTLGACFRLEDPSYNFLKNIRQSKVKRPVNLTTTSTPKLSTVMKKFARNIKEFKTLSDILGKVDWTMDYKKFGIIAGILLVTWFMGYLFMLNHNIKTLSAKYEKELAVYNQYLEKANQSRTMMVNIDKIKKMDFSQKTQDQHYRLFQRITQLAKPPLIITSLEYLLNDNKIIVIGTDLASGSAIGSFLQNLQILPEAKAVALEYMKSISASATQFKMVMELNK